MYPSMESTEDRQKALSGGCCHWVMDGVLLMVDIPGFTALSEALTREGPRGMEQLARWLEIFLQRSVQGIHEAGGVPLKYGGDALIAAFYGPEGMQRAEATARQLLRELPLAFSMEKIPGLSSPRVVITRGAWLETPMGDDLWQDRFLEGPAVRRLMELEAQAEPGTIHRDVVLSTVPERDIPLPGEISPAPLSAPLHAGPSPRIQICEEHRVASVVFLQLYRYRTWPPELDRLRQTVAHVARVVRARGGTLTRLFPHRRGQHLLLLFGIPEAGENDPFRAVRTALELVQELEYPRYVRAGVASGRVMAGRLQVGSIEEFTVLGDVVNVAARLMERARRREVCVEEVTRARTLEQVRYQPLARLHLKGKRARTAVYRATQLLPSQTWYAHPLVGREQERKQLQRAVTAGKIIAVLGPPGIGKTRLIQELERMEEVKDRALLRIRAEGPGLHLFRDLIWAWAGVRPEMSPSERTTRLARAFQRTGVLHAAAYAAFLDLVYRDPSHGPRPTLEEPRQRFERLREILRLVIASLHRTVWVVEDLHRVGPDDLALLSDLLREKPSSLSVILVCRGRELPEVLRPVVQETLVLEALSRTALEEMVRRQKLDGATLDPLVRAVLWNLSRGNPLLALAYVREAMARSWIRLHGRVWTLVHTGGRLPLPDDLFSVVLAQVDRLGQDVRLVLQTAAVMGQTFPLWLLDALLARDARPALQEAEREGLVDLNATEGWGRFVHELFREVLLRSLPEERRRQLHAAVARQGTHAHARDQALSPAFVAEHFMLAGDEEAALPYALEAGHRARQAFQNHEAETWYHRVLEITDTRTDPRAHRFHAEALWGLAQVAYVTGQYTKARTWLERYLR
ncbi:MAG: AAA family ATPase, partial [Candidatus Hydrothermae bacterium]|nr:AAA family ATPase [Candidatus Hydrothermae bacterium]